MIVEEYGTRELTSYDPLQITIPVFEATQEEIRTEMERIAARHSSTITIDPHPVAPNDLVRIKIATTEAGKQPFPGLTREAVDVQLGAGSLPFEIEDALVGKEVGDTVEVDFVYEDYSEVASSGESPTDGGCGGNRENGEGSGEPNVIDLHSVVTVLALRKLDVPEITDEWVSGHIALSNNVTEFEDRTRKKIEANKRSEYLKQIEHEVIAEIGKRLIGDVPEDAVNGVSKQLKREFKNFLKQYDMDVQTYLAMQNMTEEELEAQMARDARERVAQDIALAAYAVHEGIELADSDVNAMFSQPTPEKTYESRMQAEQSGEIDTIRDLALRAKVAEMLTKTAVFLNSDGTEDTVLKADVDEKYRKLDAVRAHATGKPMIAMPNSDAFKAAMEKHGHSFS